VLVAALILLGPPLALLGLITPFLVRLESLALERVGKTAGRIYAISALGGVAGTLLSGYFLIPELGVAYSLTSMGLWLLALGAWSRFTRAGLGPAAGALLVVPLWLLAAWLCPRPEGSHKSGSILAEDTPYARLEVTEEGSIRRLYLNGSLQNVVDIRDGQSFSASTPVLALPPAFRDEPGRLLLFGLGAGTLPRSYHKQGWAVDAVEIDPNVIRAAYSQFGLDTSEASVYLSDGRQYLRLCRTQYDAIVFDVFNSGPFPYHLVTREAVALARERLAPEGILIFHVPVLSDEDPWLSALAATLQEQFARVWVLSLSEARAKPSFVALLAGQIDPEVKHPERAGSYAHLVWSKRHAPPAAGPVLTDDLNPAEVYSERISQALRSSGS
jgi:spermidine synthase